MLSEAIQDDVLEGVEGDEEQSQALEEFQDDFQQKWRSRTVCVEELTEYCSNGPEPPSPSEAPTATTGAPESAAPGGEFARAPSQP